MDILMDSYGIKPMIINTIYTVVLTLIFCIPLGIGSAIYLAEYAKQGKIVSGEGGDCDGLDFSFFRVPTLECQCVLNLKNDERNRRTKEGNP